MLFNTLDFALFFLVVYSAYLRLPHRGQNVLLLIASYFFYGSWDWRFLSLIVISTLVDFWAAARIQTSESQTRRKLYLSASIVTNLVILGFFKYFNFFVDSAAVLLGVFGVPIERLHLNIVLPVGISFYTFQTMSYTIDVYRREMEPTHNFLNFALYVAFFPQLVAGPIERAKRLLPQVEAPRHVDWSGVQAGAWLIFWGLFKKSVIADNLAEVVEKVFNTGIAPSFWQLYVALLAFAFQIYSDFSGYSDIARGLAKCMGFDIMVNFDNPYIAVNPSDFWRRWHISLSTWLRDYLYIPLGGNRMGPRRTYVNLSLTMLLGGLWHGAAWTYVFWGAYQGLLLMGHRFFTKGRTARACGPIAMISKRIGFFHLVLVGWLLFRAQSMGQVWRFVSTATRDFSLGAGTLNWMGALIILCAPLWVVQFLQIKSGDLDAPLRLSLFPRAMLYSVLILLLLLLGNTGGHAFIYFQF